MSRKFYSGSLFAVLSLACLLALTSGSWPRAGAQSQLPVLALSSPVGGFVLPVGIENARDGSGRLFIVEQNGTVRLIKNGARVETPFLDITARVSKGGERGLLGLAFPPDYATKGYFYVKYTDLAGNTAVARYQRSANNADIADPNSEQIVLPAAQPFANHNAGHLAFGPRDGMLYVSTGDGGSGNDPGNRAQNPAELLGKMLRIDVESGRPYTYTVPPTNPFVGQAGFRPEIWALGLRNPWRYSFDRQTADLYIGDVGQGSREEINFQPAASDGGENYGWRVFEGTRCTGLGPAACDPNAYTMPVREYSSESPAAECSVTGGYVYRGTTYPRMQGLYFYADFCTARFWALRRDSGGVWQNTELLDAPGNISTFGEDEAGNLYAAVHNTGQIVMLTDAGPALPPAPTPTPATVHFSSAAFNANEQAGSALVTVERSGDTSVALSVDYATGDASASSRRDYTLARGTLRFAAGETTKTFSVLLTDDQTDEADETLSLTLSNLKGAATLSAPSAATLTINDNDAATSPGNPIDDSTFFVRQHYLDFLNREPDPGGLAFWVGGIESCGADAQCREVKRIDTSAAFFLSIEFQETGFLIYRLHKVAFGNIFEEPVPVRLEDFLRDTQAISAGVMVGVGDWPTRLEQNKRDFVNEFVARTAFTFRYPTGQTPEQFVDALNANAGGVLSQAERDDLVARLKDGQETRASALRRVAEDDDFERAEFNRAFVLMQYFGYLRRNPNDPPDTGFGGYLFWLDKLEDFNGDWRAAELVKAFITSIEYRQRFAP